LKENFFTDFLVCWVEVTELLIEIIFLSFPD
jgi:hypothetical protein